MARFPQEMQTLERLGLANFDAIGETIRRHSIDCAFETGGDLDIAVEAHEAAWLIEEAEALRALGHEVEVLDRAGVDDQLRSPLPVGGLWRKTGAGLVDPARLSWGLARAAEGLGVRICEQTAVEALERRGGGVAMRTPEGAVEARQALLATSAFPGLVGAIRRRVVPVWDYVLVTEPLTPTQREAIGWPNRQGIGDMANQFHYFRLTQDDRILWGGYDAIYDFAGTVDPALEQREASFDLLAGHFFARLPAAGGHPLHPPLGRRDRHLQPLLRLLGHRSRRAGRLHGRAHGARRRREPVRRRRSHWTCWTDARAEATSTAR